MSRALRAGTWLLLVVAVSIPIVVAAFSPLLEWREPIYIVAGFAGIIAMTLMVFQPLLIRGVLFNAQKRSAYIHRWVGTTLLVAIVLHVAGLWITSPPDVIDALLFVSATPFAVWGVTAMWSVFVTVALVAMRHKFRLKMRLWRLSHKALAVITVVTSALHAIQIDGTMETWSKYALCALIVFATLWAIFGSLVGARIGNPLLKK